MDLPDLSASEWAAWLALPPAWLALVLSVWLGAGRLFGRRHAEVVSWLEHHGTGSSYCVLVNLGPAPACEVNVAYTKADGSEATFTVAEPWPFPLSRLAANDPVYLPWVNLPGTNPSVMTVTTTWKDSRRRTQSRSGAISARPFSQGKRSTPADLRRSVMDAGWPPA